MKYYRIRKSNGLLTGDIPADSVFSLLLPNKTLPVFTVKTCSQLFIIVYSVSTQKTLS